MRNCKVSNVDCKMKDKSETTDCTDFRRLDFLPQRAQSGTEDASCRILQIPARTIPRGYSRSELLRCPQKLFLSADAAARSNPPLAELRIENGELGGKIREWANSNDWYKVDVTTNQLRLEQTFGHAIETVTKDLDRQNQSKMRRQVFDCFDLLTAKCRQIDMVCRTGCRSESEMLELEFLRGKAVGAAAELSEVLELLKAKSEIRSSKYETNLKSQDLKSQNGNPADCFISFAEAAEVIGVAKGTISKWTTAGKFKDNGQSGQKRRLLKTSVLLVKQEMEDNDLKRDAKELRQDAIRIGKQ